MARRARGRPAAPAGSWSAMAVVVGPVRRGGPVGAAGGGGWGGMVGPVVRAAGRWRQVAPAGPGELGVAVGCWAGSVARVGPGGPAVLARSAWLAVTVAPAEPGA